MGRIYLSLENYNKAYEAYQQAVYRDGQNPTFWCSIGVLYYQIHQYHDALDAYSRAIRFNPYIPEVWRNLGALYESCNNQISDAIEAYARAFDLDADDKVVESRLNYLKSLEESGKSKITKMTSPPSPKDMHPTAYSAIPADNREVNGHEAIASRGGASVVPNGDSTSQTLASAQPSRVAHLPQDRTFAPSKELISSKDVHSTAPPPLGVDSDLAKRGLPPPSQITPNFLHDRPPQSSAIQKLHVPSKSDPPLRASVGTQESSNTLSDRNRPIQEDQQRRMQHPDRRTFSEIRHSPGASFRSSGISETRDNMQSPQSTPSTSKPSQKRQVTNERQLVRNIQRQRRQPSTSATATEVKAARVKQSKPSTAETDDELMRRDLGVEALMGLASGHGERVVKPAPQLSQSRLSSRGEPDSSQSTEEPSSVTKRHRHDSLQVNDLEEIKRPRIRLVKGTQNV